MITGWYDISPSSKSGNVAILYWNHAVNNYSPLGKVDKDDPSIYTLEHYIFSLQVALEKFYRHGKKLYVHLPFFQVYKTPEGNETILTEWWEPIVRHFATDPRVEGFYMADEPEVWGTEWSSHKTPFPHSLAISKYAMIKSITMKPVLVVFCDTALYEKSYGGRQPFFDIFGFDFYPFMTQTEINRKGLGFTTGSGYEKKWILERVKDWTSLIKRNRFPRVVYVGQGCGERDINGNLNWGQRDMVIEDFSLVGQMLREHIPVPLEGYLLWSWERADKLARHLGTVEMQYQAKNPIRPVKRNCFIDFIRRLFT